MSSYQSLDWPDPDPEAWTFDLTVGVQPWRHLRPSVHGTRGRAGRGRQAEWHSQMVQAWRQGHRLVGD